MSSFGDRVKIGSLSPSQKEAAGKILFHDKQLQAFTPALVGAYLDAICLGIVVVLFIRWWMISRKTDKLLMRYLIYWLLLCACGSSVFVQCLSMSLFVTGFGEYKHWLSTDYVRFVGLVNTFSRTPSSCFFLYRAHKLCHNALWPVVVVLPMIVAMIGIGASVAIELPHWTRPEVHAVAISGTVLEFVHDVILTGTIATQLFRSRTGWKGTDELIRKVLISFAESQSPPTLIALIYLVIGIALPNSTAVLALIFYPKVVIICILFVVSSRVSLREDMMRTQIQTAPFKSSDFGTSGGTGDFMGRKSRGFVQSTSRIGGQDTTHQEGEEQHGTRLGVGTGEEPYTSTVNLVSVAGQQRA